MFTISVCMIVKNEEQTLARILDCAKKFADEIIVVDTGSTDKSIEIAKSFTNKTYSIAWRDDFSQARNFSFSKAECDYQMWLDADDFITEENIQKIIDLKKSNKDADVFMFKYSTGINKDGSATLQFNRERLLKRSSHFVWQGFVHEVIAPRGKIEFCDIEIQHRKIEVSDEKRNLTLYQKAMERGVQFSPRETYYYARELFYAKQYPQSERQLQKFLKKDGTYPPDLLGAMLMLSEIYKIQQRADESLKILFEAIQENPNSEVCCKIAYIFDAQKDTAKTVFWFKVALLCPAQQGGFIEKDYSEFLPCLELSRLLYNSSFNEAKRFHERAKELHPTHPSILFNEKFFKTSQEKIDYCSSELSSTSMMMESSSED